MMNRLRLVAAVTALLLAPALAAAQDASAGGPVTTAITKPSEHLTKLNLNQPGIVRELPVKEGQVVKQDELLLQQDDRQEQALLEALKLEADSTVKLEAAKADLKIRQLEYERKKALLPTKSASPSEVEEAEVKVVYGDAAVKVQELEQQTAKLKVKQQQVKVDQMKLTSPIDGIVEAIEVKVGELVDPQKPVMSIVKNDPCWIEFYLPSAQALKLKVGQQLEVRYSDEQQWQPATMIYRAPVADYGSYSQKIRLEMKNPQNKDTGLEVEVRLPAELGPVNPVPAPASAELPQTR